LLAEQVPVNVYVTYPGDDPLMIGATLIDSLSVGAPDYGSRYVYATWKNQGDGIYLVEVQIDPSYLEADLLNNAATRAIIVGQLASALGVISGQVTDVWGGVGGVLMKVVDTNGMLYGSVLTDPTGFYLVPDLPVGEVEVQIDPPAGYLADAETKTAGVVNQAVTTVDFGLTEILDDVPPVLSLPADIVVEATGPSGAAVPYTASATDNEDGELVPTCTPASGNTFALGATTVACSATDAAGNSASGSFLVTVRDTTPPALTVPSDMTVEASGSPDAVVTYSASASDTVDGVLNPICMPPSGSTFTLGATVFTCSATDAAGNTVSGSFSVTVIDTTPPIIALSIVGILGNDGWYVSDVSLTWSVSDDESPIESATGCGPVSLATDTAGIAFTCEATSGGGTASATVTVRRDATPPIISIGVPVDGASYVLKEVLFDDWTVADNLSGVVASRGTVAPGSPIDTASVGEKSFSVTATDGAGNVAEQINAYQVIYPFSGFFAPIDPPPTRNTVKAGAAVPVKFSLAGDQGPAVMAAGFPISQQVECDTSAPANDIQETMTAGGSSLTYEPETDQYTYVWKTEKAWTGTCRRLVMGLDDGMTYAALFQFR
jgi:hypothetical protein